MTSNFFSEAPRPDHAERNRQMEISVDYRLCHEAMGGGKLSDRAYLSDKYSVPCNTVADLWSLGQTLFAQMDDEIRADDLYDTERQLQAALAAREEGPDHA